MQKITKIDPQYLPQFWTQGSEFLCP